MIIREDKIKDNDWVVTQGFNINYNQRTNVYTFKNIQLDGKKAYRFDWNLELIKVEGKNSWIFAQPNDQRNVFRLVQNYTRGTGDPLLTYWIQDNDAMSIAGASANGVTGDSHPSYGYLEFSSHPYRGPTWTGLVTRDDGNHIYNSSLAAMNQTNNKSWTTVTFRAASDPGDTPAYYYGWATLSERDL
jgi:hypothetical protein